MKSKPHDFFDSFRPFLNNKTRDANPIYLKNKHADDIIENQKQVAETLANYFSTTASDIGGNHVISLTENEFNNHSSVQMIETIYNNSSFQFKHVNTKDAQESFENLNPRKSCNDTGLMPKLMKKVVEGIAPSVMNLYNKCIEISNWPASWKRGALTPIFKKGDKYNVENYLLIITLSTIDKVFESLLSKQITHYFDPTLSPRLKAYRKNHSCEMTLVRHTEEWKHAIDRKELVTILSTDMRKAFDSLCHN